MIHEGHQTTAWVWKCIKTKMNPRGALKPGKRGSIVVILKEFGIRTHDRGLG